MRRLFEDALDKPMAEIDTKWVERWRAKRLRCKTAALAQTTITKATAWRGLASLRAVIAKAVK